MTYILRQTDKTLGNLSWNFDDKKLKRQDFKNKTRKSECVLPGKELKHHYRVEVMVQDRHGYK